VTLLLFVTTGLLVIWGVWDLVEAWQKRSEEADATRKASQRTFARAVSGVRWRPTRLAGRPATTRVTRVWHWASAYKDAAFLFALALADAKAAVGSYRDLQAIRVRMAPRVIAEEALHALTTKLTEMFAVRRPVSLLIAGSGDEIAHYAGQLASAFTAAGWDVKLANTMMTGATDITIAVPKIENSALEGAIQRSLSAHGVRVNALVDPNFSDASINIIVGPKPVAPFAN